MIPAFVLMAIYYGQSIQRGDPLEWQRFTAIAIFLAAAPLRAQPQESAPPTAGSTTRLTFRITSTAAAFLPTSSSTGKRRMPGSFFDTNVLVYIASGDSVKADQAETEAVQDDPAQPAIGSLR